MGDADEGIALGDEALAIGLEAVKRNDGPMQTYCALVLIAATEFLKETRDDLELCHELAEVTDFAAIYTARVKRAIRLLDEVNEGAKVVQGVE